jgi:hypothetical protein
MGYGTHALIWRIAGADLGASVSDVLAMPARLLWQAEAILDARERVARLAKARAAHDQAHAAALRNRR